MYDAFISLGGNQGDVAAAFRETLVRLHQSSDVLVRAVSSFHRTAAVGATSGGEFLNAAAAIETSLSPHELLARLHSIEAELGRVRTIHWGPRMLDLDLLLFGDIIIDDESLRVPHPACWYRRFVLDPLSEIAPNVVHPVKRRTIAELRKRLMVQPLPVGLIDDSTTDELSFVADMQRDLPAARLHLIRSPADISADDLGLVIRLWNRPLPSWAEQLRERTGWLDASSIPGPRQQCLSDILTSAGL